MSDHLDRLGKGFWSLVGIGLTTIVLYLLYQAWTYHIAPNIGTISKFIGVGLGLIVVMYLVGYVIHDLPSDISEWR